jgi:hypothetical protein
MSYYVKLPDGTRVGPFKTTAAAHHWCEQRYVMEFSLHLLQDPHIPCFMRHEQGPDH